MISATGKDVGGFKTPVGKPSKQLGPEWNDWFWNPNRVGAGEAPAWFKLRLREVDPDGFVDIRWNPVRQRWVAFYRKPNFQHPLCQGWTLLMKIEGPRGEFMPLDERTLAALYAASGRKWGDGKRYFDAVEREILADKERKEKARTQEAIDVAMPSFEHSQISVAMRGKSSGSKFADYHS